MKRRNNFNVGSSTLTLSSVHSRIFIGAVPDSVFFERKRAKKENRKAGSPQAPARSHKLQDQMIPVQTKKSPIFIYFIAIYYYFLLIFIDFLV